MLACALEKIRDGLLSLAYPCECQICGNPIESWDDGPACAACWNDPQITTLFRDQARCDKCGAPLRRAAFQREAAARSECGDCAKLPYSVARSCGAYAGALEASILFLKLQPHLCPRLRRIISETFRENQAALASQAVMPVPLHRARERKRGFNQARLIAEIISSGFGLPLDDRSLVRVKHTERHRAGADLIDRARSVEGAFEVARPRLVEGLSILLVDDLYTTGSTLGEAASALLEARAARVSVFTVARVAATTAARNKARNDARSRGEGQAYPHTLA